MAFEKEYLNKVIIKRFGLSKDRTISNHITK